MNFFRRRWRLMAAVLNVVVFSIGTFSLWAIGWPSNRRLDAMAVFVDHAKQQLEPLRSGPRSPFACARPPRSPNPGKAFFGSLETAYFLASAKAGEGLPSLPPRDLYLFGAGALRLHPEAIEELREQNHLPANVKKLLGTPPSEWRYLRDPRPFDPASTDLGATVVLELAPTEEGGFEGLLLLDVAGYPSGETLCRGALPFSAPKENRSDFLIGAVARAIDARLELEARAPAP